MGQRGNEALAWRVVFRTRPAMHVKQRYVEFVLLDSTLLTFQQHFNADLAGQLRHLCIAWSNAV